MANLGVFAQSLDRYLQGKMQGEEAVRQRTLGDQAWQAQEQQRQFQQQMAQQQFGLQEQTLGLKVDEMEYDRQQDQLARKAAATAQQEAIAAAPALEEQEEQALIQKHTMAILNKYAVDPVAADEIARAVVTGTVDQLSPEARVALESARSEMNAYQLAKLGIDATKLDHELRKIKLREAREARYAEIAEDKLDIAYKKLDLDIAKAQTQTEKDSLSKVRLGLQVYQALTKAKQNQDKLSETEKSYVTNYMMGARQIYADPLVRDKEAALAGLDKQLRDQFNVNPDEISRKTSGKDSPSITGMFGRMLQQSIAPGGTGGALPESELVPYDTGGPLSGMPGQSYRNPFTDSPGDWTPGSQPRKSTGTRTKKSTGVVKKADKAATGVFSRVKQGSKAASKPQERPAGTTGITYDR